jgi:hypothetical protein
MGYLIMAKSKRSKAIDRWIRRNTNRHVCLCGCGEYVQVARIHSRPSIGIPKFIKGHNIQVSKKEMEELEAKAKVEKNPWNNLTEEEREQRLANLKSFKSGEDNPSWKGGVRLDEQGYIQVLTADHPFSRSGYMAQHRLVVEERTRKDFPDCPFLVEVDGEKYLNPKSVVHHIDEDKTNNSSGNLMLLENQSAHSFIHMSSLPMEERLRRISLGIYHSKPLNKE